MFMAGSQNDAGSKQKPYTIIKLQIFVTKGRLTLTLTHKHTHTHTHAQTHTHIHKTHTRILNFTARGFGLIQISDLHSRLVQIERDTTLCARPAWAEVIYINICM